jgi:hypothetical protein
VVTGRIGIITPPSGHAARCGITGFPAIVAGAWACCSATDGSQYAGIALATHIFSIFVIGVVALVLTVETCSSMFWAIVSGLVRVRAEMSTVYAIKTLASFVLVMLVGSFANSLANSWVASDNSGMPLLMQIAWIYVFYTLAMALMVGFITSTCQTLTAVGCKVYGIRSI